MKTNAEAAKVSFNKAPKGTYLHYYDRNGIGYWKYLEGKKGVGFGIIDCTTPSGKKLPDTAFFIQYKPKKKKING